MKKKRMRMMVSAVLMILAAAAAVCFGIWLGSGQNAFMRGAGGAAGEVKEGVQELASSEKDDSETEGLPLEIDPNAGEKMTEAPAQEEPGVAIPGWGSIRLPAGVTEAQVSLQNPEANKDWYYLTFELRLKDSGEILFTTGLIPPGQYCNQVTLSRLLEPGEYEAVMHIQPYRMNEEQTPTNNADMETILVVEQKGE